MASQDDMTSAESSSSSTDHTSTTHRIPPQELEAESGAFFFESDHIALIGKKKGSGCERYNFVTRYID